MLPLTEPQARASSWCKLGADSKQSTAMRCYYAWSYVTRTPMIVSYGFALSAFHRLPVPAAFAAQRTDYHRNSKRKRPKGQRAWRVPTARSSFFLSEDKLGAPSTIVRAAHSRVPECETTRVEELDRGASFRSVFETNAVRLSFQLPEQTCLSVSLCVQLLCIAHILKSTRTIFLFCRQNC
jgi:hypothetical protein